MARQHNGPLSTPEVAEALGLDMRDPADARHAHRLATGHIRPTWPEVSALWGYVIENTGDDASAEDLGMTWAAFLDDMRHAAMGKPGGTRKRAAPGQPPHQSNPEAHGPEADDDDRYPLGG